ncbi:hypothetical protein [Colwellia echini]|uniref:Uncharacterized protein n=1 Tax=Colwellia echini TaxID=1982103 RepID=A0ABY3MXR6_9GAMM|nr:hypothetical protein [Colwellia echini]TYK66018.1 hypothetical protein CWS31_007020 [Colwellia echini]
MSSWLIKKEKFFIKFLSVLTEVRQNKKESKYKAKAQHIELICFLLKRHLEEKSLDFRDQLHICSKFKKATGKCISKSTVSIGLKIFHEYEILSYKSKDDASGEDCDYKRPLKIRFNNGKYTKDYYAEG